MSDGMNGRGARVEGMSVPKTSALGFFCAMRSSVFGTSIFYAAEPSCFDLAAGSDQIEQYWHTFFGHAEVVDHNLRQLRQAIKVRRQVAST